ncbi:uncharacterized protein LOC143036346 [Oratosquilla oratoria]|uniref:uncharacterized protein LOC143036346 n=1 Tax=Oratosquilla oratoria TaxID=337810 RepID=UPI003F7587F9
MIRLHDKLSTRLYGFLPHRSTHHCLFELYTRLSPTSIVAFLDLKSAFDIANKDIILNQLVNFGIKGNLLRWVQGYLSRSSRVIFKGAVSATRRFDLGTPQGGYVTLLNVSMMAQQQQLIMPTISDQSGTDTRLKSSSSL